MKKIIVTENQAKRLVDSIIAEQEQTKKQPTVSQKKKK